MKPIILFIILCFVQTAFTKNELNIDYTVSESGKIQKKISLNSKELTLSHDTLPLPKVEKCTVKVSNKNKINYILSFNKLHSNSLISEPDPLSIPALKSAKMQFDTTIKNYTDLKISINSFSAKKTIIDSLIIIFNNKDTFQKEIMESSEKPISVIRATGIAFYDAVSLKNHITLSSGEVKEILQYYNFQSTDTSTDSILLAYKSNPFLACSINTILKNVKPSLQGNAQEGEIGFFTKSYSSLSGLNVTNFADGMAKFLVKRTKQEMSIAFFDKFKKFLDDSQYVEMRKLFPVTYSTLSAIDNDIYNFNAYIQTLRESFEKDLNSLLDNFPKVIRDQKNIDRDFKAALLEILYLAAALRDGEHPGKIITGFPLSDAESSPPIKGGLQTLKLVSESFRDSTNGSDTGSYWVSSEQVRNLLDNKSAFQIYLGLIYQQAKHEDIRFNDKLTLCQILDTIGANFNTYYDSYKNYFSRLSRAAGDLSSTLQKYRRQSSDSLAVEKYYNYINLVADFLDAALDWKNLIPLDKTASPADTINQKVKKFIATSRIASSIAWDVKRRSYASAIVNAVSLFKYCIPGNSDTTAAIKNLLKYGTFMATIVQTKNAEEVESAIEAFALPPGSASIKRHASIDISINAYVGLFGGVENDSAQGIQAKWIGTAGVTAPIGLAFSTAKCPEWYPLNWFPSEFCYAIYRIFTKNPAPYTPWFSSFTIFGSAIDLGAVTAYRFQNDTLNNLPELKLENIIAPGAYLVFGINGCPISIGGGVQIGPQLRSINNSTATVKKLKCYRLSAFIAADIPLLTIYSKQI